MKLFMKKRIVTGLLLAGLAGHLAAQSVYPGLFAGKMAKDVVAPLKAEAFNLKDVRLLPHHFQTRRSIMIITPTTFTCRQA